jgi:hypothetical protein
MRIEHTRRNNDALGREIRRRNARFQRVDFSFHRAAIDALEIMNCKVAASRMRLDNSELNWLAALGAGLIDKQGQGHAEFLSR